MEDAASEMPKYKCHKEVWALKIEEVELKPAGLHFLHVEKPFSDIGVTDEWIKKHNPQSGGYYVVYKDGYASFSPTEAFEEGYTRI